MEKIRKISAIVFASLLLAAISVFAFGASVEALNTTTPISLADISQHSSSTDCWTVINGKVYNLTSYIAGHPGGSAMVVICGIDGTQIMSSQHPSSYTALISSLQIGVLATPDTTAPVITLLGVNPVNLQAGVYYADAGATALDNVDGDLTSAIITVNAVDTSVAGTYTVTYTVWDAAGNSAQAVRTAIVSASNSSNETGNQQNTTHENSGGNSGTSENDEEHQVNSTTEESESHNEASESKDEEHQVNSTDKESESHNEASESNEEEHQATSEHPDGEHEDKDHSEIEDSED